MTGRSERPFGQSSHGTDQPGRNGTDHALGGGPRECPSCDRPDRDSPDTDHKARVQPHCRAVPTPCQVGKGWRRYRAVPPLPRPRPPLHRVPRGADTAGLVRAAARSRGRRFPGRGLSVMGPSRSPIHRALRSLEMWWCLHGQFSRPVRALWPSRRRAHAHAFACLAEPGFLDATHEAARRASRSRVPDDLVGFSHTSGPPAMPTPGMPTATRAHYLPSAWPARCGCLARGLP